MANTFLNPVSVPGMWGDPFPAPTQAPANIATPATAAENNAVATRPKAVAWVRMAPDILRAMAMAANHSGRTSSDIWAEAAREWLLRKSLDADYDVLSNMPARKREDSHLEAQRQRLWSSIESAMDIIRQPQPTLE